jgi:hypothetical protein
LLSIGEEGGGINGEGICLHWAWGEGGQGIKGVKETEREYACMGRGLPRKKMESYACMWHGRELAGKEGGEIHEESTYPHVT